ncbi:PD-(D/E)XK nuclease superfamily protein [Halogranum gelatinilyticum]|uniref:PD-(D/E)XK nuclease superfamily protein n=1 Tax=Halogranum gelatinilyticum TaxID=660521 RepID=A0A1G9YZC3_9EURY|nr:PD-(D/E)XK nuclease family protein [Halogranum gelatinilyticum]SDN14424.1 PD-(D/E)XK nuclease superfamily protein [Halogranum gelatinilyticum]
MSLTRAKSIDSLYEECKAFDLVLVPDAPMASALNRRLDHPHFGPFAITPRRLAARRREEAEDRLAFLELIRTTDLGWKETAYAVGNILQCWEYQGTADAVLDYEQFATAATRTAVDCIADMDTTSRRLTEYSIDAETSVAVVGFEQLTELERSVLPSDYETVDPFTEEPFDQPPFRIFDSPAAIVDVVLDTVTEENADDVAVVLDAASQYSSLVESAFEAAGVPYYGGPGFADDARHRAFLQLLRTAHAGRETRVGDVRPLLTQLGMAIDIEHDEKRLSDLDRPEVDWLLDFRDEIPSSTFAEAIDAYEAVTDTTTDAFRDELATLGLLDVTVTEPAVDRLEFYLQSYEVPVERENEGVLLADAKSAAHVDRAVVFYLGLDEGWTQSSPRRPWVDRDQEFERNIRQFQRLLQNGVDQYYLVQDTAGGSPVTPCLYFEELFDEEFDRFSDLDSLQHTRVSRPTQDGFDREPLDVPPEEATALSQSSLNTYVNSPRDYFFSRLVDNPDKEYFREGNLFHDFAEFYVSHLDVVTTDTLDEVADVMLEEVDPFLRGVDREVRLTKYRIGLRTIVEFLEANPPQGDGLATSDSGWGENFFAEYYDRPIDASHTERWFENTDLGVKGKIDLVHSPTRLLDYKSGSKKSAYSVVKHSAFDPPSDRPNFQALLYLAHQRTEHPDEQLQFTFFHFLETLDDVVTGDGSLDDCLTTVTYHPVSYEEYIASPAVFTELQEDAANDCNKTFSKSTYEVYQAVLDAHEFPDASDSDELVDSEFGEALTDRLVADVGDYKYVKNGCKQALRHLRRIRDRNYFAGDVDAFEQFVRERLSELNGRRAGDERFPVQGLGGDPNYRYVDNRDCILEGGSR